MKVEIGGNRLQHFSQFSETPQTGLYVLLLADVDTGVFKAHSLRGASTSKAFLKGVSVKEVVDHGKWSRESTWQKFYHKVVQSTSQKYQDKVLML